MSDKPHLVLNWLFDIPNYKLTCKIEDENDSVEYEALEGGCEGFNKTYHGEITHMDIHEWELKEKFWISEKFGHIVGYFQPDHNRFKKHPSSGWDQQCVNGLGPDGEYLDHMQRMQILLEGHDMAMIWWDKGKGLPVDMFVTPDGGKTIYKRLPTVDVNYPKEIMDKGGFWPEWPQACLMQPRTKGPQLSNYEELATAGCPAYIIDKCKAGEWNKPLHPELQQWYIYPT